jgi:phage tail sheath protein FI
MPEYLSPGVYVEEIRRGRRPIAGVPTDVAGFVGLAERGPTVPLAVSERDQFREIYGCCGEESYLGAAVEGFFLNGGHRCYIARVVPQDGTPRASDYIGNPAAPAGERTGIAALGEIDGISLLAVPDEVRREPEDLTPITAGVIAHCERRRDRFALVSTLPGQNKPAALPPCPDSSFAALYCPWIEIEDAESGRCRLVPPSGHVAGVIARTDSFRGVHRAPTNETVHGAVGLESPVTDDGQKVLNPQGVNYLRDLRRSGQGIVVWGARTMSSDPVWTYINVRRLFLFLEKSVNEGTQWVVCEPNDEDLWAEVRREIKGFLMNLWRQGALGGSKPEEGFFVRCDRTTMTRNDLDSGRLVCLIGVAPLRPAEFVVFRIMQKTADAI